MYIKYIQSTKICKHDFFRRACVFIPYNEHNYMDVVPPAYTVLFPRSLDLARMAKEKAGDAVTSLGLAASDGKDAVVSGTEVLCTSLIFIFHLLELIGRMLL